MSTIELAVQRVAGLDETHAAKLLAWLDSQQWDPSSRPQEQPLGAQAMIGFALRGDRAPQTTAEWMKALREGYNE
jgi:hypothetical protein